MRTSWVQRGPLGFSSWTFHTDSEISLVWWWPDDFHAWIIFIFSKWSNICNKPTDPSDIKIKSWNGGKNVLNFTRMYHELSKKTLVVTFSSHTYYSIIIGASEGSKVKANAVSARLGKTQERVNHMQLIIVQRLKWKNEWSLLQNSDFCPHAMWMMVNRAFCLKSWPSKCFRTSRVQWSPLPGVLAEPWTPSTKH
jgi:hypothetical protein